MNLGVAAQHLSGFAASVGVEIVHCKRQFLLVSLLSLFELQLFLVAVDELSQHFHKLDFELLNMLPSPCNLLPALLIPLEVAALISKSNSYESNRAT